MRVAALALLLVAAPALADDAPRDACLTRAELAQVDTALTERGQTIAALRAENVHLRAEVERVHAEEGSHWPVVVAVLVGAAAGAGVTLWAVSR